MACIGDDSGHCCGMCHLTPVVLMATHKRVKITTKNIDLLKKQTIKVDVVLVVSDPDEFIYYKETFPEIEVIFEDNKPLGRKWQAGVSKKANPLIILGSDDILAPDYVVKVLKKVIKGADLVGLTSWYSYDEQRGKLYLTEYINRNINFPLGSGKVYSKSLLEKMKYQVFDSNLNRKLDDLGYHQAVKVKAKIELIRTPDILTVKGDWDVMNPIEAYQRSRNIGMQEVDLEILKKFNYV